MVRVRFQTYSENVVVNSHVDCRLAFVVVRKKVRLLGQQELEAVPVAVLTAEVTRGVAVDVFGVDVSTQLDQGLDHAEDSTDARNVQRCPEVVGPCIYLRAKLDKNLNHGRMSLTGSQVQGCEAIRVGAVHDLKELVVSRELLLGVVQDLVHFVCITLVDFGPVIHFNFLYVFLTLFLLGRFGN